MAKIYKRNKLYEGSYLTWSISTLRKKVREIKLRILKDTNQALKEFRNINKMSKAQLIGLIQKYEKIEKDNQIETPITMVDKYPNVPSSVPVPFMSSVPSSIPSSVPSTTETSLVPSGATTPSISSISLDEALEDSYINEKELEAGNLLQRNIKMKLERNKAYREVSKRTAEVIEEEKRKRLQDIVKKQEAGELINRNIKMKLERKKAIEDVMKRGEEIVQDEMKKASLEREQRRQDMLKEIEQTKKELKSANIIQTNVRAKLARKRLQKAREEANVKPVADIQEGMVDIPEDIPEELPVEKPKKKRVLKKYKDGKRVRVPTATLDSAGSMPPPVSQTPKYRRPSTASATITMPSSLPTAGIPVIDNADNMAMVLSRPKTALKLKPEVAVEKPRLRANYERPKSAPVGARVMTIPEPVSSFMTPNRPASAGTIANTGKLSKRIMNKFGQYLPVAGERGTPPPPSTTPPLTASAVNYMRGMVRSVWNAPPEVPLTIENFSKEALKASIKRNRLQKAIEASRQ